MAWVSAGLVPGVLGLERKLEHIRSIGGSGRAV